MKTKKIYPTIYFMIFTFLIIFQKIPLNNSKLKCEPDFKSYGDNYNSLNDPQDESENFYGYEFAHFAGKDNQEYYDHWKGVYWDSEKFCYDAYDNTTRPLESLDEQDDYEIEEYKVVSSLDEITTEEKYIILDHEQSNLINLHKQMCMTKTHPLSQYNNGEYELLIKMDRTLEKKYIEKPHHFYFTIENPSDDNVTFAFKVRNFKNITENMNTTLYEWGPNPEECLIEELEPEPEPEPEPDVEDNSNSDEEESNEELDEVTDEETDTPTQEPCEREVIILNETFLEWSEEYPIPEVFYITNNYTIEPHSSLKINISLTFKPNDNITEGGYFVISEDTGQSEEPYYWPDIIEDNGKLKKLTNMEIILESDLPVGLSSYSLMRRRNLETESYLGRDCSYYDNMLLFED